VAFVANAADQLYRTTPESDSESSSSAACPPPALLVDRMPTVKAAPSLAPDLHLLPVMVSVAPRQPLTRRRPPSLPGDVVPLLGRPMIGAGRAYGPGRELMLCTRHKKSLLLVSRSIRLFDGSVNCSRI
jgi:hypothetical protein